MNRLRNNNRIGMFISKIKKSRKSKCKSNSASLSYSRESSNISIERLPYPEGSLHDGSFVFESNRAKVPATLQSSTTEISGDSNSSNTHSSSTKVYRSKRHEKHYVSFGKSIKNFPVARHHCLFEETNPIVAYFSDATLYPIPENGAGVCRAKYTTVYPYREPDIWSIDLNNDRPHHRRSSIVYS
jgi:hypothetical protein